MPAIAATSVGSGFVLVTETTLDGSTDTITFNPSKSPLLILSNSTAGSLTPVISGDESTTVTCPGVGEIDVLGGVSQLIADGEVFALRLSSRADYLEGSITVTGGTGLVAQLIEGT